MWETATGKRIRKIGESETKDNFSMAISNEGTKLAANFSDQSTIIYNAQTGQELLELKRNILVPNGGMVFSPDGRKLITTGGSRLPSSLNVWDAESGREMLLFRKEGNYSRPVFSPNGRYLVCAKDGESLVVIDFSSGKEIKRIDLQTRIYRIVYSPDGDRLAVAQENRQITLWDTNSWEMLTPIKGHSVYALDIAFSPDGQTIATASGDTTVKLWESRQNQLSESYHLKKNWVDEIGFSQDGTKLLIMHGDLTLTRLDILTGQEHSSSTGHGSGFPIFDRSIEHHFAYTTDGSKIATTGDQNIKIWDTTAEKELLNISTPGLTNYAINFSPDGRMIAANYCLCMLPGKDYYVNYNNLGVWDTVTGQQLLKITEREFSIVRAIFLKENQRLITSGLTGILAWWDLATGKRIKTVETTKQGIHNISLSSDGKMLAVADNAASVLLLDSKNGESLGVLKGHNFVVRGMAFSPDSKRLQTGGQDRTVRLWDLSTRQELLIFEQTSEAGGVAFSDDGKRIAISYAEGVVKVLTAADPKGVQLASR